MRVAWAAWVQGLLGLAKASLFVTIAVILIQQVYFGPTRLAAARAEVVKRFETERKSTIIALAADEIVMDANAVLYVPFRRAGGLESLPLLPGLFP